MSDSSPSVHANPKQASESYYHSDRSTLVDFLATHSTPHGRALDVGCAAGTLGAELLRRGFAEVVGIEPVPEVAERARSNITEVLVGTLQSVDRSSLGTFDLVVFADSLEHMFDPWEALADVRGMLNSDGVILLSVPNVSHWSVLWAAFARDRWDYMDTGLLDRTHLRFFTPTTLAEALNVAGYSIVARMGQESFVRRRYRWLRPLVTRLWPHLLVFQEYVIAVPSQRTVVSK